MIISSRRESLQRALVGFSAERYCDNLENKIPFWRGAIALHIAETAFVVACVTRLRRVMVLFYCSYFVRLTYSFILLLKCLLCIDYRDIK